MAFHLDIGVCRNCEENFMPVEDDTLGLCPTCEHESEGLAEQESSEDRDFV